MKNLFLAILALAVTPLAQAASYTIDPSHTHVQFSIRHLMVSNVKGEFSKLKGTVDFDPTKPEEMKIDVQIDATSINTRDSKRDDHLKSADFFDVTKFPSLTFKSKKIASVGDGKLRIVGDLSLRGVSKEVVLDVDSISAEIKDPWGNLRIGASATAKINRKDFGMTWNKIIEAGGLAVGEEVSITIDVEITRPSA